MSTKRYAQELRSNNSVPVAATHSPPWKIKSGIIRHRWAPGLCIYCWRRWASADEKPNIHPLAWLHPGSILILSIHFIPHGKKIELARVIGVKWGISLSLFDMIFPGSKSAHQLREKGKNTVLLLQPPWDVAKGPKRTCAHKFYCGLVMMIGTGL